MRHIDDKYIETLCKTNKGSLRKSIPRSYNDLDKYILRMFLFYSGHNSSIPVLHRILLESYIEAKYSVSDIKSKINHLDNKIFNYCKSIFLIQGLHKWEEVL